MKSTGYRQYRQIFVLLQVFGLAPIGNSTTQNVVLQLVSLGSLLLVLLILASAVFVTGFMHQNSLQTIVSGLLFMAEIVVNIIVLVQSYTMRHQQARILEHIDAAHELVNGSVASWRTVRGHLLKWYLLLAIIFGALVTELFVLGIHFNNFLLKYLLQYVYPMTLNRIRCIQIVFYVDLIRAQLDIIVKSLNGMMVDQQTDYIRQALGSDLLYQEPDAVMLRTQHSYAFSKEYTKLMSLKLAYGKLWDTSCLINDCFGWSLLASITLDFIHLTVHGYWSFLALNNLLEFTQVYESAVDIASVVINLVVMCQACYACRKQSEEIASLVNKVGRMPFGLAPGYRELVREFILQLSHEPILISANGFFTINRDLLASLGATTLSYLVILIQFHSNEETREDELQTIEMHANAETT